MGEAVKIKEGGVDRSQNQINKLKTNLSGGGVCFWVPETERQTDDKRITANGTYTAEDEGLYGYDEINVSVPNTGSMSGKGDDGNDYSVTIDDDGYIVETKIPSAIQIEIPPLKNSYTEDEPIDLTGIVVKLMDGNGNIFTDAAHPDGTIPISELTPVPATAQQTGGSKEYTDGDGLHVIKITYTQPTELASAFIGDSVIMMLYGTGITFGAGALGQTYYATKWQGSVYVYGLDLVGADKAKCDWYEVESARHVGGTGGRVVVGAWRDSGWQVSAVTNFEYIPESTKDPYLADMGVLHPEMSQIAVEWTRADGAVLSDTFDIFIESTESGTAHGF